MRILISWIAQKNDPWTWGKKGNEGTHIQFYQTAQEAPEWMPDRHVLFYDDSTSQVKAALEAELRHLGIGQQVEFRCQTLPSSLLDYAALIRLQRKLVEELREEYPDKKHDWRIFLSPGPPQMATGWILLTAGGFVRTELFQQTPKALAKPGESTLSVVDLSLPEFPEVVRLREEVRDLQISLGKRVEQWGMTARTAAMKAVMERIDNYADSPAHVLILGEQGVGKELVARALHQAGSRCARPFVVATGPSLAGDLAEAELFGYTKGAFTGADQIRDGLFHRAHEGMLFIDEIGDLPIHTQASLLRTMQEGTIRRRGSQKEERVVVRVIAATNRDVNDSSVMRDDLRHRFPLTIRVPPLRERMEELGDLVPALLDSIAEDEGKRDDVPVLEADAWSVLRGYDWPGNIRELRSVLHRALLSCRGERIAGADLDLTPTLARVSDSVPDLQALIAAGRNGEEVLNLTKRMLAQAALRATGGSKKAAAERLGWDRGTVARHTQGDPNVYFSSEYRNA